MPIRISLALVDLILWKSKASHIVDREFIFIYFALGEEDIDLKIVGA